jgi:hypothetical protein
MGLRCLVVITLSMVSSPADSIFTGFWSDFSVLQRYMQQHEEVELSALGMGKWPCILFFVCMLVLCCSDGHGFVFALVLSVSSKGLFQVL